MDMGARAQVASGSRRRSATLAVAAAAVAITIAVTATVALSSRGGTATRAGAPGGEAAPAAPTQLQTTMEWVDGLAAGHILPSDVTSRLDAQDPAMARAIRAAWSDLRSSGSRARLLQALDWVDGLAAGRILRSDVTSRLAAQDPAMATIVAATWADLGPFAHRSV